METIVRKIHFYRIYIGVDDQGDQLPFDAKRITRFVDTLSWDSALGSRYLDEGGGTVIAIYDAPSSQYGVSMALGRTQRNALPLKESRGQTTPLGLSNDEGLIDFSHLVFYDENILAVESNSKAPSISRLTPYLRNRSQQRLGDFELFRLAHPDALKQLENLSTVKSVEAKVLNPPKRDHDSNSGSIESELDDLRKSLGAIEYERIQISLERQQSLGEKITNTFKRIARHPQSDSVRVSGKRIADGKMTNIELLHEHYVVEAKVLPLGSRSRSVEPKSVIDAIDTAYIDQVSELRHCASISFQDEMI